ncbi:transposase [Streptomyces sp. NPDC013178]|uniref:transposase n=1 Tax=unclassified Streptomyces TaxID=2593676 RepID=UPI0033CC5D48
MPQVGERKASSTAPRPVGVTGRGACYSPSVVDNGAKWRALPADFPPWETVYGFFWRCNRAGVVTYIRDQFRRRIRTGKGRCPHPVTLIVDSQSVKGASTVGRNSRGYDAAKKINGRKRHITVDTLGLPVMITVTPADIQDRDAARDIFWRLRLTQPQITQSSTSFSGAMASNAARSSM